jgi:HEAT repeat protein
VAQKSAGALINVLGSIEDDAMVRANAAAAIGQIRPESKLAVQSLIEGMKADDERIRAACVQALGLLGTVAADAIPSLASRVTDNREDRSVRGLAADALGLIGPEARTAVSGLINALERGNDENVRYGAAYALGLIGPSAGQATDQLIAALQSTAGVGLRMNAAFALGTVGPDRQKAVNVLADTLRNDFDERVRENAAHSLGMMGPAVDAKYAVTALEYALENDLERKVRIAAARALGQIGTRAKDAVDSLQRVFNKPGADGVLRDALVFALGEMGPSAKQALPGLVDALEADEPILRSTAAASLARLGRSYLAQARSKGESLTTDELAALVGYLEKGLSKMQARGGKARPFKEGELAEVESTLGPLKAEIASRQPLRTAWRYVLDHTWASVSMLLLGWILIWSLVWMTMTLRLPHRLPQVDQALKQFGTITIPKVDAKLSVGALFLCGLFARSRKVYQSWIEERLNRFPTSLEPGAVPGEIGEFKVGNVSYASLEESLDGAFKAHQARIWVCSESNEAWVTARLVTWGSSPLASRNRPKSPMLPIVIEAGIELEPPSEKNPNPFFIKVQGQLHLDIGEIVDDEFLGRLLEARRILVIVPDASRISESTWKSVRRFVEVNPRAAIAFIGQNSRRAEEMRASIVSIQRRDAAPHPENPSDLSLDHDPLAKEIMRERYRKSTLTQPGFSASSDDGPDGAV